MLGNQLEPAIWVGGRCALWSSVCDSTVWHRATSYITSYRATDPGFKTEGVTHICHVRQICHPSDLHFFWLPPKDAVHGRHFITDEEEKRAAPELAGTATRKLLLPRIVSVMVVLGIWRGQKLRLKAVVLYLCSKSVYIIFPVFFRMNFVK